jgi:hypothetical protein
MTARARFAKWVALCGAAELIGISAAGAWYGTVNVWIGEPAAIPARIAAWFLMSLAAVPEGLILGGLQVAGIHWFIPDVSPRRWISATILVGLFGWGVGTFIPLFVMREATPQTGAEPGLGATAVFAAVFGVAVGAIFGLAQAWALPSHVRPRALWVVGNAIGWAAALPLIYVAAQIGGDYEGWSLRLAAWAAGGCAGGASLGVATGCALSLLERGRTEREGPNESHA